MTSHVHWGLLAGELPSSTFVQPLHSPFAGWINLHQGTSGPVFAGRHYSEVCDEAHAARAIAYIHNNPVKAGVVRDPADSDWTSHRAFLGLVAPPPWLDVERALSIAGFDASPSGRLAFHEHVLSRIGESEEGPLGEARLRGWRVMTRAALNAPVEVSSPIRGDVIPAQVDVLAPTGTRIARRWPGQAARVVLAASSYLGVDPQRMPTKDRSRDVVRARRLALLLWTTFLGHPQVTIRILLGLSSAGSTQLLRCDAVRDPEMQRDAHVIAERLWADVGNPNALTFQT
jgi:hypothetical protein